MAYSELRHSNFPSVPVEDGGYITMQCAKSIVIPVKYLSHQIKYDNLDFDGFDFMNPSMDGLLLCDLLDESDNPFFSEHDFVMIDTTNGVCNGYAMPRAVAGVHFELRKDSHNSSRVGTVYHMEYNDNLFLPFDRNYHDLVPMQSRKVDIEMMRFVSRLGVKLKVQGYGYDPDAQEFSSFDQFYDHYKTESGWKYRVKRNRKGDIEMFEKLANRDTETVSTQF